MMKARIKSILKVLGVWLIILIVIEMAAGLIAGNAYMDMDVIDETTESQSYGYFQPDQQRTILFPGLDPYLVTVNQLGLRSTGERHTEESISRKLRILCVGDSNTFGLFADDNASYPYILQKEINRVKPNVAVLNAGLGGTAVHDVLYYLKRKGLSLRPDYIILNYSTNDFDDMLRDTPVYEEIKKERLVGFKRHLKQSNFGRAFRKIYVHFKYGRFLKKIDDPKLLNILKEESRDLEDLLYVAENYETPTIVRDPLDKGLEEIWDLYFGQFEQLLDLARQRDIQVMVVMHPDILKVFDRYPKADAYDLVKERFESYGIPVIDVIPAFKQHRDSIQKFYLNPPRDFHLSGAGNEFIARAILDTIIPERP